MTSDNVSDSTPSGRAQEQQQSKEWQSVVDAYQKVQRGKIPQQWLLPEDLAGDMFRFPLQDHANNVLNVPSICGLMTERELSITEGYSTSQLLEALADSKLTALETTIAFCKRAAIAGQLTNCLTETYFAEAQVRAKELDDLKSRGEKVGPLHGLPISVKESFRVAGSANTQGFVAMVGNISDHNSPLVDILLKLGAIIYVKTNIPQTMMTADSHNNLFGRTLNPRNTSLSAGGSSGGEGALIAFRGSPLGVGTDIAGSIRIPANACGIYGFKPSTDRIPYGKQVSLAVPGADFFAPCAGPMANSISGLKAFMTAVIDARPSKYDSTARDIPWRRLAQQVPKRIRLGVLATDPFYPLHPPVTRALRQAVDILGMKGVQIVPLRPEDGLVAEGVELGFRYFANSRWSVNPFVSGEPPIPSLIKAQGILSKMIPTKKYSEIAELDGIERLAALNARRSELLESWRVVWNRHELDAVIAPAGQHTALGHDEFMVPPYTTFLNTLDYPACIIPYMTSSKDEDPHPFVAEAGQSCPRYDPDLLHGAACALQVFTSNMRDEECLAIAETIDELLNGTISE